MRRLRSRTPRARKIRPSVTVKTKPAPRMAKCTGCGMYIQKGESATYVRTRTRRFHPNCCPANVAAPTAAGAPTATAAMPTDVTGAWQFMLVAAQNAIIAKAQAKGITPEIEKHFDKFQKCMTLAIRGTVDGEVTNALRMAMNEALRCVF